MRAEEVELAAQVQGDQGQGVNSGLISNLCPQPCGVLLFMLLLFVLKSK